MVVVVFCVWYSMYRSLDAFTLRWAGLRSVENSVCKIYIANRYGTRDTSHRLSSNRCATCPVCSVYIYTSVYRILEPQTNRVAESKESWVSNENDHWHQLIAFSPLEQTRLSCQMNWLPEKMHTPFRLKIQSEGSRITNRWHGHSFTVDITVCLTHFGCVFYVCI